MLPKARIAKCVNFLTHEIFNYKINYRSKLPLVAAWPFVRLFVNCRWFRKGDRKHNYNSTKHNDTQPNTSDIEIMKELITVSQQKIDEMGIVVHKSSERPLSSASKPLEYCEAWPTPRNAAQLQKLTELLQIWGRPFPG